ncbi:MAG TPA: hypothetical protein VGB55_10495 [Tepidisphaeraceae bacterium]
MFRNERLHFGVKRCILRWPTRGVLGSYTNQTFAQLTKVPLATAGRSALRLTILITAVAIIIRIAIMLLLFRITDGREFADDFRYYRLFYENPLMLLSGRGLVDAAEAVVYSPFVPVQVWLVGKPAATLFGEFLGQRLAMVLYETAGLSITLWLMIRYAPPPWSRGTWSVIAALIFVPASVGGSAMWGQEDSIASLWTALALWALVTQRPVAAAALSAMGLYTHKIFALLTPAGIWIGAPKCRFKIMSFTLLITASFVALVFGRSVASGVTFNSYSYDAIHNSPSPWALLHHFHGGFTFASVKVWILLVTVLALIAASVALLARKRGPVESAVVLHTTFFVTFVGVQPEHQLWFMPFLIYFTWQRWHDGHKAVIVPAWAFSLCAYGYKITYGLAGAASINSPGKESFRSAINVHVGSLLPTLQLTFHILTLLMGIWLIACAFRKTTTSTPQTNC